MAAPPDPQGKRTGHPGAVTAALPCTVQTGLLHALAALCPAGTGTQTRLMLTLQAGSEETALLASLEEQLSLEESSHFRAGVAALHSRLRNCY